MPEVSGNAVIVGIGETRVGKLPGMNSQEIQAWAVQEAIADSGLALQDIDMEMIAVPAFLGIWLISLLVAQLAALQPRPRDDARRDRRGQ